MSGSKHFDKAAWIITALTLVITVLFMNSGALGIETAARTIGYENRLFDNTKVHTIDIVADNWDELIENAESEEYYAVCVVIDGEAFKNVGIRGKGNTSLSNVSSMDSDRYSFKVEFDHYDSSITYHGLDKLSLNNLIQDSTMMKDYLTYTMMNEFDAASPLCSFVYITVNGEDWGLYLAVEGIEDSFLERNYGSDYGELYKPDSMSFGGGRGNGKDFNMDDFMNQSNSSDGSDESSGGMTMPDADSFDPSSMFGGEMPEMGDFDPSQMQDDMPQMPGMSDGESDDSSFAGGFGGFGGKGGFSVDEEVLREAFDKLNIDQSLLDGIDFENITMSEIQSVISDLDEETVQALIQEITDSGSFEMSGKGGMGGMSSSDVKLQYIDDSADSYTNIWNNAKTDITNADQSRLIESLRKLSSGEEIETVVDVEQVIRYFVVHNYVCNGDSYTGSMVHNYYLYEKDGQMAMIPWDYNLAFGTFQGGDAQSTVNTPIDSPVSGGSDKDRPMWSWILSSEEYTQLYHQYFSEFLNTVDIQSIIDNAYELIKPYAEKDPTAFYTYEEFETGVKTLKEFCTLRSQSISMQLANGETVTEMSYADASELTLSDMGSMGGMGGMGGFGDRKPSTDESETAPNEETHESVETTDGFDPSQFSEGFEGMPDRENVPSFDSGGVPPQGGNRPTRDGAQMSDNNFKPNVNF